LVTGERSALQSIVIVECYPQEGGGKDGNPQSTTTITDKETMCTIYNELERVLAAKERKDEAFYTMLDPRYELTLYYSDKTDVVLLYNQGAVRHMGYWYAVSKNTGSAPIMELLPTIIKTRENLSPDVMNGGAFAEDNG
jgi:hypothetical protein